MAQQLANPFPWSAEYSHAVRLESGLIVTSGEMASDDEGQLLEGDFEAQTRRAFEVLAAVLAPAGATLDDIVQLTVYLKRGADMPTFRAIRRELIRPPFPAVSAVVVADFPLAGMLVQIQATAVAGEGFRSADG